MATAGLSRAYAVLRQLDVLRTDEVLHPMPHSSSSRNKEHVTQQDDHAEGYRSNTSKAFPHNQQGYSKGARRSVGTNGGVNSPSLPRVSSMQSDRSARLASSLEQDDGASLDYRSRATRTSMPGYPSRQAPDTYLMPPPPSYLDATAASGLGSGETQTSTSSLPSQPTTWADVPQTNNNTTSPSLRPASLRRVGASPQTGTTSAPPPFVLDGQGRSHYGDDVRSPPARQAVRNTRRTAADAYRSPYAEHVYLRHSPLSSPHRARVPSPVVLPAISTRESDHILAHASASLEDYFDKDDMPSVLASVAAAARETDEHHRRCFHCDPISLTHLPGSQGSMRALNDDFVARPSLTDPLVLRKHELTFYNSEALAGQAQRKKSSQPTRYGVKNVTDQFEDKEEEERPRWAGRRGDVEALEPITITPSVERLLDAVQSCSAYRSADGEYNTSQVQPAVSACGRAVTEVAAPNGSLQDIFDSVESVDHRGNVSGLDTGLSPIAVPESPNSLTHQRHRFTPNLSSFYTAGGPSRLEEYDLQDSEVQTLSLGTTSPLLPRRRGEHPVTAPEDLATSPEPEPCERNNTEEWDGTDEGCAVETQSLLSRENGTQRIVSTGGSLPKETSSPRESDSVESKNEESDVGEDKRSEQDDSGVDGGLGTPQKQSSESEDAAVESEGLEDCSADFPSAYTDALLFVDYLARVNAAGAHVLLKELAAMGDAWAASRSSREAAGSSEKKSGDSADDPAVQRDEDEVVDCLALSLLLNKPAALQHITVPLLRAQLKHALRTLRVINERDSEQGASSAASARAADLNSVLCAIIGLGGAAFTLLPLLLQLLLQLPPPTPHAICDVRLVGLAIRTCGAAEGLRALTRIVEERAEASHVLVAAAYAVSTYAYEMPGHTSVICVPAGVLQRTCNNDALYRLVPHIQQQTPFRSSASSLVEVENELKPLWSKASSLFTHASATAAPSGLHLHHIQSPPPYTATHIVIDAEAARQSLRMYIASDIFRVRRDHPYVMVLLDDALNSSLLCLAIGEESSKRVYKPIWDRMRLDLHRVLAEERSPSDHGTGSGSAVCGLKLPLLLYSIQDFFIDEKDMLFEVESALVHTLVSHSATLLQEQALISLCTLPPLARAHVVQPLTDFFLKVVRRYQLRHATTMRRASMSANDSSSSQLRRNDDYGDAEGAAEEAVVVAAAIAAGTACVNPLAPTSCTSSCIASIVPVFTELLYTSQWRVRHAACIGLARVGPYTPDPSSIVELFISQLAPSDAYATHTPSCSVSFHLPANANRLPALQPSTVVWCLAQQQQGGARALLRVLQDAQASPLVHGWCAYQLADVDVREACREKGRSSTPESDALLDEMVQVLGKLIAMQGALEEDTMLLCVRALAEVVHRATWTASYAGDVADGAGTCVDVSPSAATPCVLRLQTEQLEQEAVAYYQAQPLNSCFTVLTSVMEAALLPTNVLKALCLYLCKYGGGHGELYVCEMLLESASVAARSAAAFGLRACGAKVIRSVVLGMNDASFEVRREALETMDLLGATDVLAVLRHRPAEHRHQVLAALRDCLLQDVGRSVARKVADAVYRALVRQEQEDNHLRIAWEKKKIF